MWVFSRCARGLGIFAGNLGVSVKIGHLWDLSWRSCPGILSRRLKVEGQFALCSGFCVIV